LAALEELLALEAGSPRLVAANHREIGLSEIELRAIVARHPRPQKIVADAEACDAQHPERLLSRHQISVRNLEAAGDPEMLKLKSIREACALKTARQCSRTY
jgi:hypothetical protein